MPYSSPEPVDVYLRHPLSELETLCDCGELCLANPDFERREDRCGSCEHLPEPIGFDLHPGSYQGSDPPFPLWNYDIEGWIDATLEHLARDWRPKRPKRPKRRKKRHTLPMGRRKPVTPPTRIQTGDEWRLDRINDYSSSYLHGGEGESCHTGVLFPDGTTCSFKGHLNREQLAAEIRQRIALTHPWLLIG